MCTYIYVSICPLAAKPPLCFHACWPGSQAITGKMGEATPKGFALLEPSIQVFEKKAKPQEAEAKPAAAAV